MCEFFCEEIWDEVISIIQDEQKKRKIIFSWSVKKSDEGYWCCNGIVLMVLKRNKLRDYWSIDLSIFKPIVRWLSLFSIHFASVHNSLLRNSELDYGSISCSTVSSDKIDTYHRSLTDTYHRSFNWHIPQVINYKVSAC